MSNTGYCPICFMNFFPHEKTTTDDEGRKVHPHCQKDKNRLPTTKNPEEPQKQLNLR